jgi:Uma2 family endonuclease
MAVPHSTARLTEAEYLALERAAVDVKSEFYDGEMFAMSGGTRWYSIIGTDLAIHVGNQLRGKRCQPFNSELRVKVEATGLFAYPDLSIVCDEPRFLDREMDTLLNPTILVEILSDTTESYDRGEKFGHYRQIPSLKEYLLISQYAPRIEHYTRQAVHQWLLTEVAGMDAKLPLPSVGITLDLREIFARVDFSPDRPQNPPRRRFL